MANAFLDLALEVLKNAAKPLTYQEIWDDAKSLGLVAKLKTAGKTPWQSLGAQLYVDVRDNSASSFVKLGRRPARFFLKAREGEVSSDAVARIEKEEAKKPCGFGKPAPRRIFLRTGPGDSRQSGGMGGHGGGFHWRGGRSPPRQ